MNKSNAMSSIHKSFLLFSKKERKKESILAKYPWDSPHGAPSTYPQCRGNLLTTKKNGGNE